MCVPFCPIFSIGMSGSRCKAERSIKIQIREKREGHGNSISARRAAVAYRDGYGHMAGSD